MLEHRQFVLTILFLVKCRTGIGSISACGGSGYAGGGGGRVSVDIFSRHDDPVISVHGITHDTFIFVLC